MALNDLAIMGLLKTKMKWHQARQGVLAENIANSDTPDYKARDIERFTFESALKNAAANGPVTAKITDVKHIATAPVNNDGAPGTRTVKSWEVTPSGNAVSLEDQMIRLNGNQMDFQAASTLYSRALGLFRIALEGR